MTPFSIVIPAYNESKLIAHRIELLANSLPPNCNEVIIVCNGCIDDTEGYAQEAINKIEQSHCLFKIESLPLGCKVSALNYGVACSSNKYIVLLDADIDISGFDCATLLSALEQKKLMAASPRARFNFEHSSYLVKKFYRCVSQSSYNSTHRIANVIALTPHAVEQLFPLPKVIADDAYIQRSIGQSHYQVIEELSYIFHCPKTVLSALKVQTRIIRGNLELKRDFPKLIAPPSVLPAMRFKDKLIFYSFKLLAFTMAKLELSLNIHKWHKDDSSR